MEANSKHSPTLKAELPYDVIMTGINSVVKNKGEFLGIFRANIIRVIGGHSNDIPTEYEEQIESLKERC